MDGRGTLRVDGTIPDTEILLQKGWNLVGCNSMTSLGIIDATSSINCDFEVWTMNGDGWLGYTPGEPFNDLDFMEPGKGYWFYVEEDCSWNISN